MMLFLLHHPIRQLVLSWVLPKKSRRCRRVKKPRLISCPAYEELLEVMDCATAREVAPRGRLDERYLSDHSLPAQVSLPFLPDLHLEIVQAEQREEKEMTRHQRAIQLNGERENNIVQAEQREEKEMTRHQRVIQLNGERENNIVQAEQREEKEMTRHQRVIQLNGERENNIVQAEQREEKEMTRHQRVIQLNGERENNIVQAEQREEKEMT
ncbi:hypothetical protein M9458_055536, partial [Cirrhinus mrigala]